MNLQIYYRTEEFVELVNELVAGYTEFIYKTSEDYIRFKYWLAETIKSHPAYQKYGKGNSEFIIRLANQCNVVLQREEKRLSKTVLYDALEVYEAYPNMDALCDELAKKHGKTLSWRKALILIGRRLDGDSYAQETTCLHCKLHCPKS